MTKTFQAGYATGIQRVVREILRRSERIGKRLGVDVVIVVASDDGFRRLMPTDVARMLEPVQRSQHVVVQSPVTRLLKHLLALSLPLYGIVQRREIARRVRDKARHLEPVEIGAGDVLVLADYIGAGSTSVASLLKVGPSADVRIAVIYDIIAFTQPTMVPSVTIHPFSWAFDRVVPAVDGLISIARSTADDIRHYGPVRRRNLPVSSFYLGHDLKAEGAASAATIPAAAWADGPTFLMIGTIEPRKRHAAILSAFDILWAKEIRANLVMVGSIGWDVDDLLERVRHHPEFGRSLFLCLSVSDHELQDAIRRADATIMASRAEGFGLPIVESLALGTPVLASDIPVFREIAGAAGSYFPLDDNVETAAIFEQFVSDPTPYRAAAQAFSWIDWDGAVDQFADAIAEIAAVAPD